MELDRDREEVNGERGRSVRLHLRDPNDKRMEKTVDWRQIADEWWQKTNVGEILGGRLG